MKKASFILLAALQTSFAQQSINIQPNPTMSCYENIESTGFLVVKETLNFENLDFAAQFLSKHSSKGIQITGEITSIDSANAIISATNGKWPIYATTDHGDVTVRKASLKNVNIEVPGDSAMCKAFDAGAIYLPSDMNFSVGNIIKIDNYLALLNDTCYFANGNITQISKITGKYSLLQDPQSIKITKTQSKKVTQKCGRDAAGKSLGHTTARKAKF